MGRITLKEYEKELLNIRDFVDTTYNINLNRKRRSQVDVKGRTLYFALAVKTTKASFKNIGKHVGRDHSTVCHAVENLIPEMMLGRDDRLEKYNLFINKLNTGEFDVNNRADNFYEALEIIKTLEEQVKELNSFKSVQIVSDRTQNELAYLNLSSEEKKIYDDRAALVIKSFLWNNKKEEEKYEQIKCQL